MSERTSPHTVLDAGARSGTSGWKANLLVAFAVLLAVLLASCADETAAAEKPSLVVAIGPWPGFLPAILAEDLGWFEEEGVEVELRYTEDSRSKVAEFVAGRTDGLFYSFGGIVVMQGQAPDLGVVLLSDLSQGGDGLVADPSIGSVEELRGRVVGIPSGSGGFGEFMVRRILKRNGVSFDEIEPRSVRGEHAGLALERGEVDAAWTWDPHLRALEEAGYPCLSDSSDPSVHLPDALAFRGDVLSDRPEDVRAFLRAWFRAVDRWLADPEDAARRVAARTGLEADAVREGRLIFVGLQSQGHLDLERLGREHAEFLVGAGYLVRRPPVERLWRPGFLPTPAEVSGAEGGR